LELQLLTVHGTLREMTSEYLRLDGLTLWLSPVTQRRGALGLGRLVSATVVRLAQDQYLALVVQGQGGTGDLSTPDVSATPWQELRRTIPRVLPSHREDTPESRPIVPPGLSKKTEQPYPTVQFEATAERKDEDRDKTPEPTRTLRPSRTPKPTEFEAKSPEPTKQTAEAEHEGDD
ncbi:MAG: hypothetical protein N3A60_04530, partial [Thermanaerothrix sp.]|nr:hypothetical protein [Thermanaerothrix sp.]